MILFIVCAAALAGAALAMLAPALRGRRPLNRDDSAAQNIRAARRRLRDLDKSGDDGDGDGGDPAARAEIELALLEDLAEAGDGDGDAPGRQPKTPGKIGTALILGTIPAAAAMLYLQLGAPEALIPPGPAAATVANSTAATAAPPSMDEVLRRLEQALIDEPDHPGHWALAGRAYMAARRFADAERAYRHLHGLVGDDPGVLTAWADAAVMAAGGAFPAAARARINRALELAPANKNALWLAALAAESAADYRAATGYLQRLLPLLEDDDGAAARAMLARLQQRAENGIDDAAPAPATPATPAPKTTEQ